MTLRILSGEFGGRFLKAPSGHQTRPTTSMLRKAVFDILQPDISGSIFVDLCSGSGAIGIEALSRGAKKAIFVDSHRESIQCLKANLSLLKITTQALVFQMDVFKALLKLQQMQITCDIIYADPPYHQSMMYVDLLRYIDESDLLKVKGLLFFESPIPSPLDPIVTSLKQLTPLAPRRYGRSQIYQFLM